MKKRLSIALFALLLSIPSYSQMLFSENLTLSIDSAKTIQGSLMPVLDFKTEQENILTVKNTANLNVLIKHRRVINLINKLEFSTYGNKVTVSGGYVHTEYRYLLSRAFEVYPYAESEWAGSRGLEFKVSTGLQSRYRLVNKEKFLMFAAAGVFYEFEKWKDDSYFKKARFGGAVDLLYKITPAIGINGSYRLIYDTAPIVPIRKSYTAVEAGLNINF